MAILAFVFFYPTLWWNLALCRVSSARRWWDWIDDHVLLGALPIPGHVEKLKQSGIGAVINTCREWRGPVEKYRAAGIEELYLPTTDFMPPTLEHIRAGVAFIRRHAEAGRKVYVHCKAGRGRSATIVICYLIAKGMKPEEANTLLLQKRPHANRRLLEREVVRVFAAECVR